jgi:hypothetical protein
MSNMSTFYVLLRPLVFQVVFRAGFVRPDLDWEADAGVKVKDVLLQLESRDSVLDSPASVRVAADVRWGVWEVLFGRQMPASSDGSSCSVRVGDSELSLTLALARALSRCPVDVRGERLGNGALCALALIAICNPV